MSVAVNRAKAIFLAALEKSGPERGTYLDSECGTDAALHQRIADRTCRLVQELRQIAARRGVPFTADFAGSMWGFFFRSEPVRSFTDAKTSDAALFRRFFHAALERGVYLAPSPYEAAFMSAAHGDAEVDAVLDRLDNALGAALA